MKSFAFLTAGIFLSLAISSAQAQTTASYTASKVVSGVNYQCVIFSNGRIKCWGSNTTGQLGLGDTTNRGTVSAQMGASLPFIDLGSANGVPLVATDVVTGDGHTCALMSDGSVKCWGQNDKGQLGLGDSVNRGASATQMGSNLPTVNLGTGLTAKQLALGTKHTCAILSNNLVKCWGDNTLGQLGIGSTTTIGISASQMGNALATVNLGTGRTARSIAAGSDKTCVILDNNSLKCWGDNYSGDLGQGSSLLQIGDMAGQMGDNLPAINLGTVNGAANGPTLTATAVSVGASNVCAILSNSLLKCWGDNSFGQVGIGSNAAQFGSLSSDMGNGLPFVNLGTGVTVSKIQLGYAQACALLSTNAMKCWGTNFYGQLGLGTSGNSYGLTAASMGNALPAVNFGTSQFAKSMSSNFGTTCVITQSSNVKCWGVNTNGAVGIGSTYTTNAIGAVPGDMGDSLAVISLGPDGSSSGFLPSGANNCLSISSAVVGFADTAMVLSGGASIHGNAVLLGNSTLNLSGGSSVTQAIFTPSATAVTASAGTSYGSMVVQDLTSQSYVFTYYEALMASLSPNFSYNGVTTNVTVAGTGNYNFVKVNGDINLSGANALTLQGGVNDIFVINVTGNITLGGAGAIRVSGAVPATNIVFLVQGTGGVNVSGGSSMLGTIVVPNGGVTLSGGTTTNGAIFAKGTINLSGSGSDLNAAIFCPTGGLPIFM